MTSVRPVLDYDPGRARQRRRVGAIVSGVAFVGLSLAMFLAFVAIVTEDWNAPTLSPTKERIAAICLIGCVPVGVLGFVLVTIGIVRRRQRARETTRLRWQRAQEAVR